MLGSGVSDSLRPLHLVALAVCAILSPSLETLHLAPTLILSSSRLGT